MSTYKKVASDAFKSIQLETGILLKSFNPANPGTVADADIICATTGGIKPSIVANYDDYGKDIDNCPENTKELKRLKDYTCKLSFDALNVTPDVIKLAIGAADITSTSGKITPRADLKQTDFTDSIWWVGDRMDGGFAAICLKNALSTGGLSLSTQKDGKGKISVELTGHYSLSAMETVPMEFYVIAAADSSSSGSSQSAGTT